MTWPEQAVQIWQVLIGAGYEDAILHRTGHSLGESVHGNGVRPHRCLLRLRRAA